MARKATPKARSAPKAPAASARSSRQKPLSDLSPAYRKRIERAEAKGLPRQAARGHKPAEHVARRQRELASGGLTTYQRGAVDKFAREQAAANKNVSDPDQMAANLLRAVRARGYEEWFRPMKARQRQLKKLTRERTRKTYRDEAGNKYKIEAGGAGGGSANISKMEAAADEFDMPDIPDDDERWHWFYYH